ncbi:hypothetical protein V1478_014212 [Vespula squamosa]|uniref:Uncharacterized protein n=1 Tax=Vespula squamosa TaxID=30214 RepID=A0ABD2A7F0_VESSQ
MTNIITNFYDKNHNMINMNFINMSLENDKYLMILTIYKEKSKKLITTIVTITKLIKLTYLVGRKSQLIINKILLICHYLSIFIMHFEMTIYCLISHDKRYE